MNAPIRLIRVTLNFVLVLELFVFTGWLGQRLARAEGTEAAPGAVFAVTTGADSGSGSLRWAISAANANPGLDTITWVVDCMDRPVSVVRPRSPLPAITDPLIIDGAPGESCPYPMQLDGSYAGDSTDGLRTWSPVQELPGLSGTVRHVGVISEPA